MSSSDVASSRTTSRVTLGSQILLKKNTFQGLVIPVPGSTQTELDVAAVVKQALVAQPRLRKFQSFPRASRLRTTLAGGSVVSGLELAEASEDDALCGVGDRLLHLLQRWQVIGVVLVVAHRDSSLSGRLLGGPELYKLATEAAKLALEQHYVDAVAQAAKITAEIQEAERLTASTTAPSPNKKREQPQQVIPAACVMSSATVPSWPQHHQPTSDGGGRKHVKQGRINHFRHREMAQAEREQQQQAEEGPSKSGEGGLEWLGISREEWRKLRSIRVPVKELHYLFMCLVVLIEPPTEQRGDGRRVKPTPKQQEQFTPSDFSWVRCRDVLHRSAQWSPKLRGLRGAMMAASQAAALRGVFQEPTFNESAFVRIAGGAGAKIFSWLQRLLDEFDEKDLGLLRIDAPSETACSPRLPISPDGSARGEGEGEVQQQHEGEQREHEHEQPKAPVSPELRAMQSVDKDPASPSRKQPKIVDPGRLFNTPNATRQLQLAGK